MGVPMETTYEVWTGYESNGHVVMSRDITYREKASLPDPLVRARGYRDSLGIERRKHAVIIRVSRKEVD